MHEEEICEIRQINVRKEAELEQLAIKSQQERVAIFEKAKLEAKVEEQKKRAKFQAKLENIKKQEIAEFKRMFMVSKQFEESANAGRVSQNDQSFYSRLPDLSAS